MGFDEALCDVQTEAEPWLRAVSRLTRPRELVEQGAKLIGRDATALVRHDDLYEVALRPSFEADLGSGSRILGGVGEQVLENSMYAIAIEYHARVFSLFTMRTA